MIAHTENKDLVIGIIVLTKALVAAVTARSNSSNPFIRLGHALQEELMSKLKVL